MLRRGEISAFNWPDKTLSVLVRDNLEACEKRLSLLPRVNLWQESDERQTQTHWQLSYDGADFGTLPQLTTLAQLRETVLDRMPAELVLLPMQEYDLIDNLVLGKGRYQLTDWSETAPAESLVRRLWCTVDIQDSDHIVLEMSEPLLSLISVALDAEPHVTLRWQILQFFVGVISAINVYGMIYADDVRDYLYHHILRGNAPRAAHLVDRLLRVEYDYIYNRKGEMVLLHPGLAEPERWLGSLAHIDLHPFTQIDPSEDVPQIILSDAERGAAMRVAEALTDAVRPDIPLHTAVEDLRVLAKQAVSDEVMQEVLRSLITVRPNREMRDAIGLLRAVTPGFACVSDRVMN